MLIGGEQVTCQTEDFIRLHGFFLPAGGESKAELDAVFISHAIGGNFYNSRFLTRLALSCHDAGLPVLMANNRGHDVVNYVAAGAGRKKQGAAFEKVSDCRLDYAAWIKLLSDRGFRRIGIIGHSLGAIKAIYSQAFKPREEVAAIVAFSASRLRYQDFIESPHVDTFLGYLNQAKQLCNDGKSEQLMEVDFPFPILISAGTYVDKYDDADRYNWLNFVDKIQVPTWLAFGERELNDNAAFQGLLEQVQSLGLDNRQFETEVVPGANHYYTGCQQEAADRMIRWFSDRFAPA